MANAQSNIDTDVKNVVFLFCVMIKNILKCIYGYVKGSVLFYLVVNILSVYIKWFLSLQFILKL